MAHFSSWFYWVEERAYWHKLRGLGSSNLVKASVLMPAFGYMLLLNDQVHQYLTIKYDGMLLRYLPDVWRIWLLFYGSFFLAAATLLYGWFCPEPIKRHISGFAMADAEHLHHVNLKNMNMLLGELRLARDRMTRSEKAMWGDDLKIGDEDPSWFEMTDGAKASNTLIYIWNVADQSHVRLRCFVFLLFWVGLMLIALPAVFTFVQVTLIPVKRLL